MPPSSQLFEGKRVALVHDWLTGMRGGEKILEVFCELFPDAPLYAVVHNPGAMSPTISAMDIRTTFIDRLPFKSEGYRRYLPLMPAAMDALDFKEFDFILSTSVAVAKAARPRQGAFHLCYCNTPMRYIWDQYDEYFGAGRAGWLTRSAMSLIAPYLREWDLRTTGRVTRFIANSENVRERIRRIYMRESDVIYPPVDTDLFNVSTHDDGYFLLVSALVPYKRVDIAIHAFNELGERLLIVGSGPERTRLERIAARNVTFLGWQSDEKLSELYGNCRALVFPGEEDFGIVPLEAMASGKPVVALGKGGALETVISEGPNRTGVFFRDPTPASLVAAVDNLNRVTIRPNACRAQAEKFSRREFKRQIIEYLRRIDTSMDSKT